MCPQLPAHPLWWSCGQCPCLHFRVCCQKNSEKLSCEVCRANLITAAVPSSFDQTYHLLELKNNGGLMIPSEGTVKVVRAAERVIRQKTQKNKVSVCPSSTVSFGQRLVQRMCSYSGSTLQKPNSELRTIISCLCHLWCLYFTK